MNATYQAGAHCHALQLVRDFGASNHHALLMHGTWPLQVRLPNGEPVSVRIGLHFGPAGDGLIGVGKSVHYQCAPHHHPFPLMTCCHLDLACRPDTAVFIQTG